MEQLANALSQEVNAALKLFHFREVLPTQQHKGAQEALKIQKNQFIHRAIGQVVRQPHDCWHIQRIFGHIAAANMNKM